MISQPNRDPRKRRGIQIVAFSLLGAASVAAFLALGVILYYMIREGSSAISWSFLTEFPRKGMTEGGIFPALVGSFYLTISAILAALPFALASATWLSEYSKGGWYVRLIRIGINSLAGVPSIVLGLVGLAFFVKVLGIGVSLLAGALTLALLILPILIRAAEEALQSVPMNFREGALALGATQWHAIRTVASAGGCARDSDRSCARNQPGGRRDGSYHVHRCGVLHGSTAGISARQGDGSAVPRFVHGDGEPQLLEDQGFAVRYRSCPSRTRLDDESRSGDLENTSPRRKQW